MLTNLGPTRWTHTGHNRQLEYWDLGLSNEIDFNDVDEESSGEGSEPEDLDLDMDERGQCLCCR